MKTAKTLFGILAITAALAVQVKGQIITNGNSYWQPSGILSPVGIGWQDVAISGDGSTIIGVQTQPGNDFVISTNYGVSWIDTGYFAYGRKVGISGNGQQILVPSHWGDVNVSTNRGQDWMPQIGGGPWQCASVSADGTTMAAGTYYGGNLWVSRDSGATWNAYGNGGDWMSVSTSQDGHYMIAGMSGGQLQVSTNYGVTWNFTGPSGFCSATAMSLDGKRIIAGIYQSNVFVSTNYGTTWQSTLLSTSNSWTSAASSADGSILLMAESPGRLYRSLDFGHTWTTEDTNRNWQSVSLSADASQAVATDLQDIYTWHSLPSLQSILTNGLVVYYPFNGNANDASGNGNNASFIGTNFLFNYDPSCTITNGTFRSDAGNIFPPTQDAFTESFWIKSTQLQQEVGNGYLKHIVFMTRRTGADDSGDGGWATLDINNFGYLDLTVDDDGYGNQCYNTNFTASTVFDGAWHHVVGVREQRLICSLF